MDDCTLVVGVDEKHLRQLERTYPTWIAHKSSLVGMPMIVFYDRDQVKASDINLRHPSLTAVAWPPPELNIAFWGDASSKWTDPQRHKMLAGFVHVPAQHVRTKYWLKLDTDVVATGVPNWIDRYWFADRPAIVSHPWGFTKPADQMIRLDIWSLHCWKQLPELNKYPLLQMIPTSPDSDRLKHPRIISWCAFFETEFTQFCSELAERTCGPCQIPVPSQDGYMWYIAERTNRSIRRAKMKPRGWEQWMTKSNIEKAVSRSLGG